MEKIFFNPETIKEVRLVYKFIKLSETIDLIHKKGEIVKHWTGLDYIAKEDMYMTGFIRTRTGYLSSIKKYLDNIYGDGYFDSQFDIGPDSKIYYKPCIKLYFIDDTVRTRIFNTDEELENHYKKYLEPYLNKFIHVNSLCV